MDERIKAALGKPINYSEEFTLEVSKTCNHLADQLDLPLNHVSTTNYSASQEITLCLDRTYLPVEYRDKRAEYQIKIFISSRGPFFTYLCKMLKSGVDSAKLGFALSDKVWVILEFD